MATYKLTKNRLIAGVWEGSLTGAGPETPQLTVSHQGETIEGLTPEYEANGEIWYVKIPIPAELISDGVQTFVIQDANGDTLNSFALLSGEALAEDIRAEVDLLRNELDMLKQAFRHHCNNS
ncbi:hypothetical protein [Loktanella sp. S4079]|uniref:hypothetical protein n=1 Tax=Loktanella sp. S4079 TaxID=579483 RepID=UPI0005FA47EB|nr:hypothetical protein [Loktanella sp. S4079]KJZ19129.1 hypothetical protein TW80_10010 [Loktanella sp. S4079]